MQQFRVFITGICGFIGYHVALRLKKEGCYVAGCDTCDPYYDPKLKAERANNLEQEGILIFPWDIVEIQKQKKHFEEIQYTHLIHLAAQPGVRYSLTHPEPYIHTNIQGFLQILELCRALLPIKLIYASSSSVYGLTKALPFTEEDPCNLPPNLYAASKKASEMMAFSYHHLYRIPMIGLRFFTVYGPWGRPDMAYFSFAKKILKGEPITVYGEGKLKRDFTFIEDIVQGIVATLTVKKSFAIYNLGNHQPASVLDLVRLLEKHLSTKAITHKLPRQKGEVEETFASIEKSKQELGFSPRTSLDEGIRLFCQWLQNHRNFID